MPESISSPPVPRTYHQSRPLVTFPSDARSFVGRAKLLKALTEGLGECSRMALYVWSGWGRVRDLPSEHSDFVNYLTGVSDDELESDKDIGILVQYSLISRNENLVSYSTHRLVQLTSRIWLSGQGASGNWKAEALMAVLYAFTATLSVDEENLIWKWPESCLPTSMSSHSISSRRKWTLIVEWKYQR